MPELGNIVWTFDSVTPRVIGPLTVIKVKGNNCTAQGEEKSITLGLSNFYDSREMAARMGKSYYEQMIRGKELYLTSLKFKVKDFCKKEDLDDKK